MKAGCCVAEMSCQPWGIGLVGYQAVDRPILITLRHSALICHCQSDQDCATQAIILIHPNLQPIDYFSHVRSKELQEETGNTVNGSEKVKVTLLTSTMTGVLKRKYGLYPRAP